MLLPTRNLVYIVPNIIKDSIRVYSNCESVKLSCGKWNETKKKSKNTSLYKWYNVSLDGNLLVATALHKGKIVATDTIALPTYKDWDESILKPADGYHYIYNINLSS